MILQMSNLIKILKLECLKVNKPAFVMLEDSCDIVAVSDISTDTCQTSTLHAVPQIYSLPDVSVIELCL